MKFKINLKNKKSRRGQTGMTRRVGSLLSFVLHITFAVRLCLCLRLRLAWRPARSWVQRAEVSRRFLGSLLLLGKSSFSFFSAPLLSLWFLRSRFSPLLAGLAVPASCFFSLHVLSFSAGFSGTAQCFSCAAWKRRQQALCFVFFYLCCRWCRSFFSSLLSSSVFSVS